MIGFNRLARNVGNQVTHPAATKAVATATGRNTPDTIVRHAGRGSSAGLNSQRTARVHTNSGYPTQRLEGIKRYPQFNSSLESGGIFLPNRGSIKTIDHRNPKYLV